MPIGEFHQSSVPFTYPLPDVIGEGQAKELKRCGARGGWHLFKL